MEKYKGLIIPALGSDTETEKARERQTEHCFTIQKARRCFGLACPDCLFYKRSLQSYMEWERENEEI